MGLMLVIFSPDFDFTNSLLMKIPIGCLYLRPLGAVSSTERSAILRLLVLNVRILVIYMLGRRANAGVLVIAKILRVPFCIR